MEIQRALVVLDKLKEVLLSDAPVSPMTARTIINQVTCPPSTTPCPWFDEKLGHCQHFKDRPIACFAMSQDDDSCRHFRMTQLPTPTPPPQDPHHG